MSATPKVNLSLAYLVEKESQGDLIEAIRCISLLMILDSDNWETYSKFHERLKQSFRSKRNKADTVVGVICSDITNNSLGRAIVLNNIHAETASSQIIGVLFENRGSEIWEPAREISNKIFQLKISSSESYLEVMLDYVIENPKDLVHVSKPRWAGCLLGMLYKFVWGATLILDIDDEERLFLHIKNSADANAGAKRKLLFSKQTPCDELDLLAINSIDSFDAVTVSNAALQKIYGGIEIPHVKFENSFIIPGSVEKTQIREKYSLPVDKLIIVFLGTPRKHKGLLELCRVVKNTARKDILVLIVGSFEDANLESEILGVQGVDIRRLQNIPLSKAGEILACADVFCNLPEPDNDISSYQLPSKIIDAIGSGLSVYSKRTAPLDRYISDGVVRECTSDSLVEELKSFVPMNKDRQISYFKNNLTVESFAGAFDEFYGFDLGPVSDKWLLILKEVFGVKTNILLFKYCYPSIYDSQELRRKVKKDIDEILMSGFFDAEWYVDRIGFDDISVYLPALHFLINGISNRVSPSEYFSSEEYLDAYPSVELKQYNPLLHYIRYGLKQGYTKGVSLPTGDKKQVPFDQCNTRLDQEGSCLNGKNFDVLDQYLDRGWYFREYGRSITSNVDYTDEVAHYLRYGRIFGLNPCENFSTQKYCLRYPDVAKSALDPFVHYLSVGAPSGYVSETAGSEKLPSHFYSDVYVTCWLRKDDSIHSGVVSFCNEISRHGLNVSVISHAPYLIDSNDVETVDYSFDLLRTEYPKLPNQVSPEYWELEQLIEAVRVRIKGSRYEKKGISPDIIRSNVIAAWNYWYSRFLFYRPSLMFVWGSTSPLSRLHISLCKRFNIHYYVLERGYFNGMLGVYLNGQFAHSEILYEMRSNGNDWYSKFIADYYKFEPIECKACQASDRIISGARTKILFIGVNDFGCGISYDNVVKAELHSPIFHSTRSALEGTLSALERIGDNCDVYFKPHPADPASYDDFDGDILHVIKDVGVEALIKSVDVCITLSTTVSALCIVYEKPLITLSFTDINYSGFPYECSIETNLVETIRKAIARDDFNQRLLAGKQWIGDICSTNNFSCGDWTAVPDISVAASSLGRFAKKQRRLLLGNRGRHDSIPFYSCRTVKFESPLDTPSSHRVTIVMPIYRDVEISCAALRRALQDVDGIFSKVVVVEDCSPDPKMKDELNRIQSEFPDRLDIINNSSNLGFVGSVNKGIDYSGSWDIVLLNADAIIPVGFLRRIVSLAYSHDAYGTVTPFSNNASIYSVPTISGESLDFEGFVEKVDQIDTKLCQKNSNIAVEMPVGHGFCMFIKRELIDVIGFFDETSFGTGYSEEVDFCLRARRAGYINVCAPGVFVGHIGGISFGDDGNLQRIRNRELISRRYPWYFPEISEFVANDPIADLRIY